MSNKEAKRQKKLKKKRAKTKTRLSEIAVKKQSLTSGSGKMLAASSGEVVGCFISDESQGLRSVLLIRRGPQGMYGAAFFLLDLFCLGVKDCGYYLTDRAEVDRLKESMDERLNLSPIDPSTARAIVEASVSYAGSFGLPPHNDYRTGKLLWGKIPVGEVPQDIEFGRNGKPFYVQGPFEDPAKQAFIMNCLATTAREGVGLEDESSQHLEKVDH